MREKIKKIWRNFIPTAEKHIKRKADKEIPLSKREDAYKAFESQILALFPQCNKAIEAIGWTHAYCCASLDRGKDPRDIEAGEILKSAIKDLNLPLPEPPKKGKRIA